MSLGKKNVPIFCNYIVMYQMAPHVKLKGKFSSWHFLDFDDEMKCL